jgi:transcriptional regulator with XRE-family HTH domain
MSRQLRAFLAAQIRSLRGDASQADFGKRIGKPQSVVSRLEDEGYGNVTVRTLIAIAQKLNVALIVRFVDYPTFLRFSDDYSQSAIIPQSYDQEAVDKLAASHAVISPGEKSIKAIFDSNFRDVIPTNELPEGLGRPPNTTSSGDPALAA